MPANLPDHLITPPPEYLKDTPVGETWFIGYLDRRVDAEPCYLNPMAERREAEGVSKIKVWRERDGYHVILGEARPAIQARNADRWHASGHLCHGSLQPMTAGFRAGQLLHAGPQALSLDADASYSVELGVGSWAFVVPALPIEKSEIEAVGSNNYLEFAGVVRGLEALSAIDARVGR
jgi:hypothetical protein